MLLVINGENHECDIINTTEENNSRHQSWNGSKVCVCVWLFFGGQGVGFNKS